MIFSSDPPFKRLDHYKLHEYTRKWNFSSSNKEPVTMTLTTSIDAMFKRKRGRPPKNRVIEVRQLLLSFLTLCKSFWHLSFVTTPTRLFFTHTTQVCYIVWLMRIFCSFFSPYFAARHIHQVWNDNVSFLNSSYVHFGLGIFIIESRKYFIHTGAGSKELSIFRSALRNTTSTTLYII